MGTDRLPVLPLLLCGTPPGLELILRQEGIAFHRARLGDPKDFRAGKFVLYDSRSLPRTRLRDCLTREHVAIDVDSLRQGEPEEPFAQLLDVSSKEHIWRSGSYRVRETVHRVSRPALRLRLLGRLRNTVARAGGLWARLAAFPYPYRSAFNLRVDLDEPSERDYLRFAASRRSLADCTTHFVSTSAYGDMPGVLDDLRRHDTQSHGHFHHIYRDLSSNRRNLRRAHEILVNVGIGPIGFAAPHGRWNPGLNRVLEELGYAYSSEFQVGYDDVPFFPWCEGRFSRVLQVPIHPVCEGLFFDTGLNHPWPVADYLRQVVRAKIEAGEPAFIYGHPERRLARHPEILSTIATELADGSFLWRVTMTEFARWWLWRDARRWALHAVSPGSFEIHFENWGSRYPLGLEIQRGEHVATIPIREARQTIRLEGLAYERRRFRADLATPTPAPPSRSLRAFLRRALDWEVVTPIEELTARDLPAVFKRQLRSWRGRRAAR